MSICSYRRLRDLSTNDGFSQTRSTPSSITSIVFLGAHSRLTESLKQTNQIDVTLADQLDQLEFAIADSQA